MDKLYKKILSVSLVYFTTAASYATAPDWPLGGTFGGAPFPPPASPQAPGRQKFTSIEDAQLRDLVGQYGTGDWPLIASHIPGRNVRQCKERWMNYLAPGLNRSAWTPKEDALLLQKFYALGPRWVQIAQFFPGRTDINCRSRWNIFKRREQKKLRLIAAQLLNSAPPPAPPPPTQSSQNNFINPNLYGSNFDDDDFFDPYNPFGY
jgi:hypothetical protein